MAQRAPSAGWVDHEGGPRPLPYEARVQVQFRADRDRVVAERQSGPDGNVAGAYDCWEHTNSPHDIVGFRQVAAR